MRRNLAWAPAKPANPALPALLALLALGLAQGLAGCTVVRDGTCPTADAGTGDPEPAVVDLLVLADLDRGTVNLAMAYGGLVDELRMALAAQEVTVRHAALAPLHHRMGEAVPLLYGEGDPDSPFMGFGDAMAWWAADPESRLEDAAVAESENLARLGPTLASRTLYRPEGEPALDRPYFESAADGFVVLHLSGTARRCGYAEADCRLSGTVAGDFFTRVDEGGAAAWLSLPGDTGLPPERIFHVVLATPEAVDFDTMASACLDQPGFPPAAVDVIAPGGAEYYGPLVNDLEDRGGAGTTLDLCTAFSETAPVRMLHIARTLRGML